jgi:hypothetical protein
VQNRISSTKKPESKILPLPNLPFGHGQKVFTQPAARFTSNPPTKFREENGQEVGAYVRRLTLIVLPPVSIIKNYE